MIIFIYCAPVAQLDRASGYEPEGREFESPRARHLNSLPFIGLANSLGSNVVGELKDNSPARRSVPWRISG